MISQTLDIFIERPPQAVFDFISDPSGLPPWNLTFRSASWTSGDDPGVGSTFHAAIKAPATTDVAAEITQWEPARLWGYVLRTPFFPMEGFETTYSLEPENGGTRLTVESRTELSKGIRFLEGTLFRMMGDKEIRGNLERLKGLLESAS